MLELKLFKSLHPFTITQGFGRNDGFDYTKICTSQGRCLLAHNGLDCIRGYTNGVYNETEGANVRVAHNGIVSFSGVDSFGGYFVEVRTTEQYLDKTGVPHYWKTIYYHLRPNIRVRAGQRVQIGDILGYADNTGLYTTGSHLHFGLKQVAKGGDEWTWITLNEDNGYFGNVNPLPYLDVKTAYEWKIQLDQIL